MTDEGDAMLAEIVERAKKWSEESGLKAPFTAEVQVTDYGFLVYVSGSNGTASCTFQRDGRATLYERTSR